MYHNLETTKKPLIGKTLQSIVRLSDHEIRVNFLDYYAIKISVEGDCCSHSIFYAIDTPPNIDGAILQDIVEGCGYPEPGLGVTTADSEEDALARVKMGQFDFSPEENSVWNVVLVTDRGNILLRHINSSNGYYDGMTSYEVV